jgi:hypothetical protein
MSVTVNFTDRATPELRALAARLTGRAPMAQVAAAVTQLIKRHLIAKNKQPNEMGFPKTGFYGQAAEAARWHADTSSATVTISHEGFAQRYFGGTIRPVKKKALAIPVHPEAYGRLAREIKNLVYAPLERPTNIFAYLFRPRENSKFGEVYYLLAKSVRQKPDKTVMPKETAIQDAIHRALQLAARK